MKVYDFQFYKDYLNSTLSPTGQGRGARSRLAHFLNCQTGFISQVLGGHVHFSLEHALKINEFLQHDGDEKAFFMLLVHKDRAGTKELEKFYQTQIEEIKNKRSEVHSRILQDKKLSLDDQNEYYSYWFYAAIHVLVSIEAYQTKAQILERLKIERRVLDKALKFLTEKGLIKYLEGRYTIGPTRIHLSKDSHLISKHHMNWRLEALKSLETIDDFNLHYSSVVTLAKEDAMKIKGIMLNMLEDSEKILIESPEEEIYSIGMDFFKL